MRNEPDVLSFDELCEEIYKHKDDINAVNGIAEYVQYNLYSYCLMDLEIRQTGIGSIL